MAVVGRAAGRTQRRASAEGGRAARLVSPRIANRALIAAGVLVAVIAGLVPLVQDSGATLKGYELRDMERTRDEWRARTQAVENEIAGLVATERIRREAARLGMVAPERTVFLRVDVPGPSPNAVPARYTPEQVTKSGPDNARSTWDRIVDAILP